MISNDTVLNQFNSPVRQITAKVGLYSGSTLVGTYTHEDALVSIEIERVGEGNFFGFGICQKANVKLIDVNKSINVTTANFMMIYFNDVVAMPRFNVTEVNRDENTGELSITAYDGLYESNKHTVSELTIETPYNVSQFATACAKLLGLNNIQRVHHSGFTDVTYEDGANFDGTETIREALDAVAEVTQTIYYVTPNGNIYFKKLDKDADAVITIDKDKYFTLDSKTNRRLSTITHVTALGDDVTASTGVTGSTQFIRDNPFWNLRDDIATRLDTAIANVGGTVVNQFECEWRGNPLIEIGDKINLVTKEGEVVTSYLLDDVISYDGTFSESTQWCCGEDDFETASNPTSLGDIVKQTYARVDKVNKEIELVASETKENSEAIAALQINTDSISASVQRIEENTNTAIEDMNGNIETLTNRVEATMTAEDVTIAIQKELDNGVDKVVTTTGYVFDENGLTVSKTGSEMTTTITEDGMTVYKDDEAVLVANHDGVDATNLRATTYLIIGTNSRFEDYEENGVPRTGCFWIGA